jgi:hypothetical protein
MTYQAQADLSQDEAFAERLGAALTTEGRARTDYVARVVMTYPPQGVQWFMPFISSAPGFADKFATGGQESITDGDLLSAVQASWADVGAVHPETLP